jgi:hypothetical protein
LYFIKLEQHFIPQSNHRLTNKLFLKYINYFFVLYTYTLDFYITYIIYELYILKLFEVKITYDLRYYKIVINEEIDPR